MGRSGVPFTQNAKVSVHPVEQRNRTKTHHSTLESPWFRTIKSTKKLGERENPKACEGVINYNKMDYNETIAIDLH